jgi:hypothetical protein
MHQKVDIKLAVPLEMTTVQRTRQYDLPAKRKTKKNVLLPVQS